VQSLSLVVNGSLPLRSPEDVLAVAEDVVVDVVDGGRWQQGMEGQWVPDGSVGQNRRHNRKARICAIS